MALGQSQRMTYAIEEEEEGAVWQIRQRIMECAVRERLLCVFALGDVTIDDDQLLWSIRVAVDNTGNGLQYSPGTVFVAYTIFKRFPSASQVRLLGRFRYLLPVGWMYLLQCRSGLQVLRGVPQNVLIGRIVVQTPTVAVDNSDHVSSILSD